MGTTVSETITLSIVEFQRADTPLEPLSEDGFVWLLAFQVSGIPGTINTDFPVWIKLALFPLLALPVYSGQSIVSVDAPIDPNGTKLGVFFKSTSGAVTTTEQAFPSGIAKTGNSSVQFSAKGVLPPVGRTTLDAYTQVATLAPQLPQIQTNDLLAEIIRRQTNPQDSRKLTEDVTITVGKNNITNKLFCIKERKKYKCRKHHKC